MGYRWFLGGRQGATPDSDISGQAHSERQQQRVEAARTAAWDVGLRDVSSLLMILHPSLQQERDLLLMAVLCSQARCPPLLNPCSSAPPSAPSPSRGQNAAEAQANGAWGVGGALSSEAVHSAPLRHSMVTALLWH